MSVTAVTNTPDEIAGSNPNLRRIIGTQTPAIEPIVKLAIIAKKTVKLILKSLNQIYDTVAVISARKEE